MTTTSKSKMVTVASVDGGVVTISGTASFTNQQAIVRFTLKDTYGNIIYPTSLEITAVNLVQSVVLPDNSMTSPTPTEQTLTLTTDGSTNVIYAALRGISGQNLKLRALVGGHYYNYEKADVTFENGKFYAIGVKMRRGDNVSLSTLTTDYTAQDGDMLSGTLPSGIHLSIADGASVTLKDVTISEASQEGITCLGDATIILDGTNDITSTIEEYPAIKPGGSGTTLTIQGSGSLTARGGSFAAGIGTRSGIQYGTCGNITIESGIITAYGGQLYGAAIGSGLYGTCGNITISGGTVTAQGGEYSAAIGSGRYGKYAGIFIGDGINSILAYGGTWDGSVHPAPIGNGIDDYGSGTVTVDGTTSWTAGMATEHLNWDAYNGSYYLRWTLTHK